MVQRVDKSSKAEKVTPRYHHDRDVKCAESVIVAASHMDGPAARGPSEILFATEFDYLHRPLPEDLLPVSNATVEALNALGEAMGKTAPPNDDSPISAIYTYLGQFIDHDLTRFTDEDGVITRIGSDAIVSPVPPDTVRSTLKNGRRPRLDLDNLYGRGPALSPPRPGYPPASSDGEHFDGLLSDNLFDGEFLVGGLPASGLDVPRLPKGTAIIADARNDENLSVSQLQAAMLTFHNAVAGRLHDDDGLSRESAYVRGRQLVTWVYQYIVLHQYLMAVCHQPVVQDVAANGSRFLGAANNRDVFMPLEFSVAGFRFGHSMIRPSYDLNAQNTNVSLMTLLDHKKHITGGSNHLPAKWQFDWNNYLGASPANKAKKIDPHLASDLNNLPAGGGDPVLVHLARRNLLRGFNLSIPTGQAMCRAAGLPAIDPGDLASTGGAHPLDAKVASCLKKANFHKETPLWFYVLREAQLAGGDRLGELGSRIVCETIIGMLQGDPQSFVNARDTALAQAGTTPAIGTPGAEPQGGVAVPGAVIGSLEGVLRYIGRFT